MSTISDHADFPNNRVDAQHIASLIESKLAMTVDPARITLRDNRWFCPAEGDLMVLVAADALAETAMRKEQNILKALANKTRYQMPSSLQIEENDGIELRRLVSGNTNPDNIMPALLKDRSLAIKVISDMGELAAALHNCLDLEAAGSLVDTSYIWPPSAAWIEERLPDVIDDIGLVRQIVAQLTEFDLLNPPPEQRVFCHGDLGFHNVVFNDQLQPVGVFDFVTASLNEAAWDLRYFTFDPNDVDDDILSAGLESYRTFSDRPVSFHRVRFYNAIAAVTFLAYRKGIDPNTRWCGRTLKEDLHWTRLALSKLI